MKIVNEDYTSIGFQINRFSEFYNNPTKGEGLFTRYELIEDTSGNSINVTVTFINYTTISQFDAKVNYAYQNDRGFLETVQNHLLVLIENEYGWVPSNSSQTMIFDDHDEIN